MTALTNAERQARYRTKGRKARAFEQAMRDAIPETRECIEATIGLMHIAASRGDDALVAAQRRALDSLWKCYDQMVRL